MKRTGENIPPRRESKSAGRRKIPLTWRGQLQAQLAGGEGLLAFFEPNLDSQLDFADSLVVLTDRRFLAIDGAERRGETGANGAIERSWRSWPVKQISELRTREA